MATPLALALRIWRTGAQRTALPLCALCNPASCWLHKCVACTFRHVQRCASQHMSITYELASSNGTDLLCSGAQQLQHVPQTPVCAAGGVRVQCSQVHILVYASARCRHVVSVTAQATHRLGDVATYLTRWWHACCRGAGSRCNMCVAARCVWLWGLRCSCAFAMT